MIPMRRRYVLALTALVALCSLLAGAPARATAPAHPRPVPERVLPAQVLVIGGTPAGIAAAVTAARHGLRVRLVCARPYLGGLLTGAMMDQWDFNNGPDGAPIERGFFREVYDRLGESFDPQTAERLFLHMVQAYPEITLHLSATPISAHVVGSPLDRRIRAVRFVDQRSGARFTIGAPIVIDATDDGDVAAMARARYDVGRQDTGLDTKMQAVTLMFAVDGVDWRLASQTYDADRYGTGGVTDKKIWGYSRVMRAYAPLSPQVTVRDLNLGREPSARVTVNAVDIMGIDGRIPASLDEGMEIGRAEVPHLVGFLRERIPGFAHAHLVALADELYVRETRHILGLTTLSANDIWHGSIPYDSIGLASYPLDVHPSYAGEEPAYAPIRHVYGVPFRAMVPYGFDNLLVAGPAISATHQAEGSVRIIPTTMEEGQAAGVAAAISLEHRVDFTRMAYDERWTQRLRTALTLTGAVVDLAGR